VGRIAISGSPGSFCLLSPQAFPLVAGLHDGKLAAVVVATRVGQGRAVDFGNDGYFSDKALARLDTGRLMLNAVGWVGARGNTRAAKAQGPRVAVRKADGLLKFLSDQGVKAFAADGGAWLERLTNSEVLCITPFGFSTQHELEAVGAFVANGGGLILAGCPWGWVQLTHRDLRTQYPDNLLLGSAGVVAADTYLEPTAAGGFLVTNPPEKLLHAQAALDFLAAQAGAPAPPDKARLLQATHTVTLATRSVTAADPWLLPRIRLLGQRLSDQAVPQPGKPVRESSGLARAMVALEDAQLRTLPPQQIRAHPSAAGFPYPVPTNARHVTRQLELDTRVPEWHSTGLYAAPGEVIAVTLGDAAAGQGLGVRIGAHTDDTWHLDAWERWPSLSWHAALAKPSTPLSSPFGGLIYLEVPDRCSLGVVSVQISNAVEAPYFVLGKTSLQDWREFIRDGAAPWAELECPGIILTIPSKGIRHLEDPAALLKLWDRVVRLEDDLAAWKPEERRRPERMVCDQQISAGYMHSGYPVMTHLDVAELLTSVPKLLEKNGHFGRWGLWHELGHNHQSTDWTPAGTGEVTVNMFSMYVITQVHGEPLELTEPGQLARPARLTKIKAYLASDQTPASWGPFTGLVLYFQLIDGFGWDVLKKVLAEYRALPTDQRPRSDLQKWDQWMVRYSQAAGRNLGPFFQKWRIPVTQRALDSIKNLPAWFHPDFGDLTESARSGRS